MKFSVPADVLQSALTQASAVTPTRAAALVAYTGVLLTVTSSQLSATGSDGEITVGITIPVQDTAKGSALVQPKRLIRWLANLPKGEVVTIQADGATQLVIHTAAGQEYRFRTMVATFPTAGESVKATSPVDLSGLKDAIAAVRDAADEVAGGSSQQVVQVVAKNGDIRLHTTDRLRLARAVLKSAGTSDFTVLIGLKALEMAERLGSSRLGVDKGGRILVLEGESHRITARTVDSEFPPVEMLLAQDPVYSVHVPRASLRAALERLACVWDDTLPLVLEIDGHELTLRTEAVNVGGGQESIALDSAAAVLVQIGVNLGYLASAVSATASDTVTIGWTGPLAPLFVYSSGHPEVTSVLAPVKLSDS